MVAPDVNAVKIEATNLRAQERPYHELIGLSLKL